ncbi:MAG: Glu/Leu/Phe/Val dehydrogenase [bacterium]|nr:Glu/Leu/Phe/Val dehydrogenase [bacterium]
MEIFDLMKNNNQEQIAFYTDKSVKLRAILAIHNTALGPAMGGIRILKYESGQAAMNEVTMLSQAMTRKAAAAGLNVGGGQIVVVQQEGMEKKEPMFRAIGRFVDSFKGRFIAGPDVGVTENSMEYVGMETRYLTGLPSCYGGSGDPSRMGAYGALKGIQAAAKYKWNSDDLTGKKIILQGYGRIGSRIAELLKNEKAEVLVADIDAAKVKSAEKNGYKTIPAADIFNEPCDILAPCAVGSVVTPETAEEFQCGIIAGPANHQWQNPDDGLLLKKRDILYVPDFIINCGALIDIAEEYTGYKDKKVLRKVEHIYDRVLEIFNSAEEQSIGNNSAAIQYASKRIESIMKIKGSPFGQRDC